MRAAVCLAASEKKGKGRVGAVSSEKSRPGPGLPGSAAFRKTDLEHLSERDGGRVTVKTRKYWMTYVISMHVTAPMTHALLAAYNLTCDGGDDESIQNHKRDQ